jgi:hypothetical protein
MYEFLNEVCCLSTAALLTFCQNRKDAGFIRKPHSIRMPPQGGWPSCPAVLASLDCQDSTRGRQIRSKLAAEFRNSLPADQPVVIQGTQPAADLQGRSPDGCPVRYGQGFKKPSRGTLRQKRSKRPARMFPEPGMIPA